MLSRSGIYALKALLELALDPPRWQSVSALAEAPLPAPVRQLLCALPAASELRHPAPGGADAGTSE